MNSFFDQLKKEHQEVKSLFKRAESAPESTRSGILDRIKNKLIPHARAEEKTLYASLLEAETGTDLEDLLKEAYAEHHAADTVLNELEGLSADDEMWKAKLSVLKENVEHHINEEEENLFPKASKFISEDLAKEMLKVFRTEKERFQGSEPTQSQIHAKKKSTSLGGVSL